MEKYRTKWIILHKSFISDKIVYDSSKVMALKWMDFNLNHKFPLFDTKTSEKNDINSFVIQTNTKQNKQTYMIIM